MRINHNIAALNTYRQLNGASSAQAKSMEKLSSGLRINRAGDDAAGLAISEKMRGQIRGLEQAQTNAQDGISMIQTAEGALNETHSILQRMRELATQASNDTNTDTDRGEIQKEINQLTSEINRIGNTTEFNTQKLLDGGEEKVSKVEVTTATAGFAAAAVGAVGITTATASIAEITGEWTISIATALANGDSIEIGGVTITAGTAADFDATVVTSATAQAAQFESILSAATTFTANYSVIDNGDGTLTITENAGKASGSALVVDDSGVTNGGKVTDSEVTPSTAEQVGKYTLSVTTPFEAGESITVGGQKFTLGDDTADIDISSATTAAAQAALIENALTAATTLSATYTFTDNSDGTITIKEKAGQATGSAITASAGGAATQGVYNFELGQQENGNKISIDGQEFTFTNDPTQTGAGYVQIGADADATAANLRTAIEANSTLGADYVAGGSGSTIQLTQEVGQESSTAPEVETTKAEGNGFTASFQVGANEGQSMSIEIEDMRANALGLTASKGTEGFTSANTVTDGTNNNVKEAALDVSTHESASAAITKINDAIETVSAQRSNLGAYQNRLDHTINNLGTSTENLTAAESRIRDVDMAKEMMEQTKASILSQASQAMLAQANQMPQGVLQLLR